MINFLKKNFDLNINQDIKYLNINNIIINNNQNNQYSILLGQFDKNKNSFNIKLIMNYNNSNILEREQEIICSKGINKYITKNLVFNKNNDKDNICPIFSDNEIIGYAYKYNPSNKNYSNSIDYYKYLSNRQLLNRILLYYNEIQINKNIINSYNETISDKYFLLNNFFINKIKSANKDLFK